MGEEAGGELKLLKKRKREKRERKREREKEKQQRFFCYLIPLIRKEQCTKRRKLH